jgi:hypothetical protein
MASPELDALVRIGKLKSEPGEQSEFDGFVESGRRRLQDAERTDLALESRFDLAYNAAHALALAALRWWGYRSENRYLVFQALVHTLGLGAPSWRVLVQAHGRRNEMEYEGISEVDEQLLHDLLGAAKQVYESVVQLGPVPERAPCREGRPAVAPDPSATMGAWISSTLWLRLADGAEGEVDLSESISFRGVSSPLAERRYFLEVRVDPEPGTIRWPNGAHLDPDVLYSRVPRRPLPVAAAAGPTQTS